MEIAKKLKDTLRQVGQIETRLARLQEAVARVENRQLAGLDNKSLQANEFRASSQWGEDGIIQFLLREVEVGRRIFVEFGVETYVESNTRFLLTNDNWSGLVIDGSQENIQFIKDDPIYWRHNLKAECAFITRDNINDLIRGSGVQGEIGILSVDIDGNDYWVWEAIEVVRPVIVVAEYNARFGPTAAVTVPYDASFVRSDAHHSMIYYGASLSALHALGERKGYALVGCNSSGNNAFFVRSDRLPASLPSLAPEQAFVRNQFRETRDSDGKLAFVQPENEFRILEDLPLVDVSRC